VYPLVDLFAGPGGLGEGFASLPTSSSANSYAFRTAISIEKDVIAHQTLQLRHFFRQFPRGAAPNEYYQYLENRISLDELYAWYPDEAGRAGETAWQCTLGEEPRENVRERIEAAVNGHRKWVLVGGPPCQVYSLAGRSSMKGVADFDKDPRHTLYKEYLRIIIDHQPPVFVMENVKGLISSRRYGHYVINDILRDLNTPRLYDDDADSGLRYRLYSLSQSGVMSLDANPKAFVVKAEEYGIPQARHRIFLVGIRSDIAIEPRILAKIDTPVTVRDVIGGLPCIRSGISRSEDSETLWRDTLCQVMEQDWFVRTGDIALSDIRQRVEEVLSSMPIGVQAKSSNHYTPPKVFQDWFTDKRLTVLLT
jgi:DNA (cytosine-5)-methyltransferase 1